MLAAPTTIQQQQLYLYPAVPCIDLHDTKKLDEYIKGSGTAHHTQLHKIFTQKKTSRKRKTAKES